MNCTLKTHLNNKIIERQEYLLFNRSLSAWVGDKCVDPKFTPNWKRQHVFENLGPQNFCLVKIHLKIPASKGACIYLSIFDCNDFPFPVIFVSILHFSRNSFHKGVRYDGGRCICCGGVARLSMFVRGSSEQHHHCQCILQ